MEKDKQQHQQMSEMKPVTEGAYGGGLYGTEGGLYGTEAGAEEARGKPPASETQSADGPQEAVAEPKHPPPPSTGDRDLDITGQSYIQ